MGKSSGTGGASASGGGSGFGGGGAASGGDVLSVVRSSPKGFLGNVSLADVRAKLGGTRASQDAAILSAMQSGKINLAREDNPSALSPRDRDAALTFHGAIRHYARLP